MKHETGLIPTNGFRLSKIFKQKEAGDVAEWQSIEPSILEEGPRSSFLAPCKPLSHTNSQIGDSGGVNFPDF